MFAKQPIPTKTLAKIAKIANIANIADTAKTLFAFDGAGIYLSEFADHPIPQKRLAKIAKIAKNTKVYEPTLKGPNPCLGNAYSCFPCIAR